MSSSPLDNKEPSFSGWKVHLVSDYTQGIPVEAIPGVLIQLMQAYGEALVAAKLRGIHIEPVGFVNDGKSTRLFTAEGIARMLKQGEKT